MKNFWIKLSNFLWGGKWEWKLPESPPQILQFDKIDNSKFEQESKDWEARFKQKLANTKTKTISMVDESPRKSSTTDLTNIIRIRVDDFSSTEKIAKEKNNQGKSRVCRL